MDGWMDTGDRDRRRVGFSFVKSHKTILKCSSQFLIHFIWANIQNSLISYTLNKANERLFSLSRVQFDHTWGHNSPVRTYTHTHMHTDQEMESLPWDGGLSSSMGTFMAASWGHLGKDAALPALGSAALTTFSGHCGVF